MRAFSSMADGGSHGKDSLMMKPLALQKKKYIIKEDGTRVVDDGARSHIFFQSAQDAITEDIAEQAKEMQVRTVKKIGEVQKKEMDFYQKINWMCRSGSQNPKRNCCKSLRSALIRQGSQDEKDLDEEGMVKDEGRWDYKSGLVALERRIKDRDVKPIFNLDGEIREYINRSFVEGSNPHNLPHK